jgi:hypothetical protein
MENGCDAVVVGELVVGVGETASLFDVADAVFDVAAALEVGGVEVGGLTRHAALRSTADPLWGSRFSRQTG